MLKKRRVTRENRRVTGVQRHAQEDAEAGKQEGSADEENDQQLNSRELTFFSLGMLMVAVFFKVMCQDDFFTSYLVGVGLLSKKSSGLEEEAEETEEEKRQRFLNSFGESRKVSWRCIIKVGV